MADKARLIAVDRLQPGDHACLSFGNDEERWQVLRMFALRGFARGEKVMIIAETAVPAAEVTGRLTGTGRATAVGPRRGQLEVHTTAGWYLRGSGFDPDRALAQACDTVTAACAEGFTGLRATGDMSWALRPGILLADLFAYERAVHRTLAGDPRLTGLCQYDRDRFGTEVTARMSELHGISVLERSGAPHISATAGGLRMAGDCDLTALDGLRDALRAARDRLTGTIVIDIADLSFLDARCAAHIALAAGALDGDRRLELRGRPEQLRMLRLLSPAPAPHLRLVPAGDDRAVPDSGVAD